MIRKAHIDELRSALDAARAAIGLPAISYTDSTITAQGTVIESGAPHGDPRRDAMTRPPALGNLCASRDPESAKRDEGSQDAKTPAISRSFAVFAAQDDVNNDLRRGSLAAVRPSRSPISAIVSPRIPTSGRMGGRPVPSMTVPLRMRRSK